MKAEILKILKKEKDYVSGQELCESLGVSRTAVWKAIRQLEEQGYVIEAVRNKGYRLVEEADVLTVAELHSVLDTKWLGKELEYYYETDSTNNRARDAAEKGASHGFLAVADCQTAGKGRRGRVWNSPHGTDIYMSFVLRPTFTPSQASMLTLVAGMAVVKGVQKATGLSAMIKWPNDAVVNGKKICGILTEMSTEEDAIRYVVPGIGTVSLGRWLAVPCCAEENRLYLLGPSSTFFRQNSRGMLVVLVYQFFTMDVISQL